MGLDGSNWIVTTIAGAAVGAVIPQVASAALFPFRRMHRDQYTGSWHEYYWTWHGGSKTMWTGRVTVKRGITKSYSVRVIEHQPVKPEAVPAQPTRPALRYKGELILDGPLVVLSLRATTHSESVVVRYPRWIPSSSDLIAGIWSSYDHSGTPAAGAVLLSRNSLNEAEAAALISSNITTSPGFLRLRDQNLGSASRQRRTTTTGSE
jgi:hypothetical protein